MATHSSIFERRIPWTEELGRLLSMGLQNLDTAEHSTAQDSLEWPSTTQPVRTEVRTQHAFPNICFSQLPFTSAPPHANSYTSNAEIILIWLV